MTPLLATFQIDNNTLMAGVVAVFATLFGLYVKLRNWEKDVRGEGDKREVGPQPFEVSLREKPISHREHETLCEPLHHRVGTLENDVRVIRLKMEADKHEIINSGSERVKDLHRRIDGIPGQVIALLKDTKGLIP